jgi:hypothetical protein
MGQNKLTAWARRRCSFTLASTDDRFVSFSSSTCAFLTLFAMSTRGVEGGEFLEGTFIDM